MWHPEHFTCTHCGREVGSQPFYERDSKAYCPEDYHQLFAPRCAYCTSPIKEVCDAGLSFWPSPILNSGERQAGRERSTVFLTLPFGTSLAFFTLRASKYWYPMTFSFFLFLAESPHSHESDLAPRTFLLRSLWEGVWQ